MRVTVGNTVTFCMALSLVPPLWKEAPFIRLLVPFVIGIILQQYLQLPSVLIWTILLLCASGLVLSHFSSLFIKLKFNWLSGLLINLIIIGVGYNISLNNDESSHPGSIQNVYSADAMMQVTVEEPLIEKSNSYKALVSVDQLIKNDSIIDATGKLILYFQKDSNFRKLDCGSTLLFSKTLSPISSSGNPGSFDYQVWCKRQGIFFSVYLSPNDYILLPGKKEIFPNRIMYNAREIVLDILSRFIPGAKESGFAKALLIGYKDELDKNLVTAYSNTGVVHIIAISGLHLGIIFWLLTLVFRPLQRNPHSRWFAALLIVLGLWLFSLLAGAGPSVLRSAFMFSFLIIGNTISKKTSVFNNLAVSAFALLCLNTSWLWDAGFQLSYAAVLSIVIFFKPIYNLLYFQNKIVDFAWKLNAVTLSAQVLTIPISIYHFHQFPLYFLVSNLFAVPWSSLILLGEILLICCSFIPQVASTVGAGLQWMIQCLNTFISNIDSIPLSVWNHLQISGLQLLAMYVVIAGLTSWILMKKKNGLIVCLSSLLIFIVIRTSSFYKADAQQKLIVYNLKNAQAIDLINGREYYFIGDSTLRQHGFERNFFLEPSRTMYRTFETRHPNSWTRIDNFFLIGKKSICIIDQQAATPTEKIQADILILSQNPKMQPPALFSKIRTSLVIADGTVRPDRIKEWRQACDAQGIKFHSVSQQGALILDLN